MAYRFPVFFGWFPGPVKISSRAKVEGIYPGVCALLIGNTDWRTADYRQQTAEQLTTDSRLAIDRKLVTRDTRQLSIFTA